MYSKQCSDGAVGNHELYITDIAYETFNQFSKVYGDKYVTSNVQIINPATGQFEYVGKPYRYFTTQHGKSRSILLNFAVILILSKGLRIMAFGVLYDFKGNSNVSKVIKAADLVKEKAFLDAVNYPKPIDLFLLIGHNPARMNDSENTLGTVYKTIRGAHPDTPIQAFGGHSHIRYVFLQLIMCSFLMPEQGFRHL